MTNEQIAIRSGLARATVAKISFLRKWDALSLSTVNKFAYGCGVDLLAPGSRRDRRLVTAGKLTLLKNASAAQRRMYSRILDMEAALGTMPVW